MLDYVRAGYLNAVYFKRGLTCISEVKNDLIDGGQPRSKPHLCKAKPNHARFKNRFWSSVSHLLSSRLLFEKYTLEYV